MYSVLTINLSGENQFFLKSSLDSVFLDFLVVIILCILATSFVFSSSVVVLPLSLMDDSALRFFLVFLFFGLVIMLGVVSGELSGLF